MHQNGALGLSLLMFFTVLLTTPAHADYSTGMKAYSRGEYGIALHEWLPLAEQGEGMAQYSVGILFAHGQGVPQDYIQAHFWFSLAATQGRKRAETARDNLAKKMTNEQITEAHRLVREWKLKGSQK